LGKLTETSPLLSLKKRPAANDRIVRGLRKLRGTSKQMTETQETPNIMKTNYLSAPVTAINSSLVTIAAWSSCGPTISQKETKRTKVRGVGFAFLLAVLVG